MNEEVRYEEALSLVKRLSLRDQARLIREMVPELERALKQESRPRPQSFRGLWKGLEQRFPRKGI